MPSSTQHIGNLSAAEMANLMLNEVLPGLPPEFRTIDLLRYMEKSYGLSIDTPPTVSMGKPGRRARWRQMVSDALSILLKEGYISVVQTRRYRKISQ